MNSQDSYDSATCRAPLVRSCTRVVKLSRSGSFTSGRNQDFRTVDVVNSIGNHDAVVGADVLKAVDAGYVFTLADIGWSCVG